MTIEEPSHAYEREMGYNQLTKYQQAIQQSSSVRLYSLTGNRRGMKGAICPPVRSSFFTRIVMDDHI